MQVGRLADLHIQLMHTTSYRTKMDRRRFREFLHDRSSALLVLNKVVLYFIAWV